MLLFTKMAFIAGKLSGIMAPAFSLKLFTARLTQYANHKLVFLVNQ